MPLFGSSKRGDKLQKQDAPANRRQAEATGIDPNDARQGGTGAMPNAMGPGGPGAMNTATGPGGPGGPGTNNDPMYGAGRPGRQGGAGMNDGGAADYAGNSNIPPSANINNNANNTGGRGGTSISGKVEHAVGSVLGSNALKAKGLQKEQEAQGFKVQSQELAEAERLEREASLRRERAVAHGAHPDNRHLGGIPPNASGGPNAGAGY